MSGAVADTPTGSGLIVIVIWNAAPAQPFVPVACAAVCSGWRNGINY